MICFSLKLRLQNPFVLPAQTILWKPDGFTGPHFRDEEDTLSCASRDPQGRHGSHAGPHDGATATVPTLAAITSKDTLAETEVHEVKRVLVILPHVSECDRLAVFIGTL